MRPLSIGVAGVFFIFSVALLTGYLKFKQLGVCIGGSIPFVGGCAGYVVDGSWWLGVVLLVLALFSLMVGLILK